MKTKKINWTNMIFMTITPVMALIGTAILVIHHGLRAPTLWFTLFYTFATGLSITAGYHRLYSHTCYKAHYLVRLFYVIFGSAAFQGSVLEWSTDHRNHHRYTDTDKDPYDIKKGFWFAHLGWLFYLDPTTRDYSNVEDLNKDPMLVFQNKYYKSIAFFTSFAMPTLIASLWGDPLGGLILAGLLRLTLNHHFTFCINSVCHLFGEQTFSDRQSARDNWITALFTYGEGFHNFHHQFPLDYRNGIRFYHYDPSKWLIKALSYFGLARDLKQISEHKIIQYKVRADEKRILEAGSSESYAEFVKTYVDPIKEMITQLLGRIEELEKHALELRQQGIETMKEAMEECQQHLRQAHVELKRQMTHWARVIRLNPRP